jgi:hypothetical protein
MKNKGVMDFDVDLWRSDEGLALLRPASRDFWHEAVLVMWKAGQRGVLSGSVNDLAKLCRSSPPEARAAILEIKARNVADVFVAVDEKPVEVRDENIVGNRTVTLVNRKMAREWGDREKTRQKVAKCRENKRRRKLGLPPLDETVTGDVTPLVTGLKPQGVTGSVPAGSAPSDGSPPHPLSLSTPTSRGDASHPRGGQAAAETGGGQLGDGRVASRKTRERKTSDAQNEAKVAFDAWYIREAFPRVHDGVEYPAYDGADAAAVWKLLKSREIGWNLERAKSLAEFFLREPEMYGVRGHRLRELGQRLGQYLTRWQTFEKRGAVYERGSNASGRKPTIEQRGQFAEPARELPEFGATGS